MWLTGNKSGFSFVELMITMVILCVGLVLVIQGFITAAAALNRTQNMISACSFLDTKMQELEATAKKNNGIKKDTSEGTFSAKERDFNWNLDISAMEKDEEMDLSEDLNVAKLEVSWDEQNQPKDLAVMAYVKNKK